MSVSLSVTASTSQCVAPTGIRTRMNVTEDWPPANSREPSRKPPTDLVLLTLVLGQEMENMKDQDLTWGKSSPNA